MDHNQNQPVGTGDTTPKVTGIGGIFFFANNPTETKDWYSKNLGIEINSWGSASFDSRDLANPETVNTCNGALLKPGTNILNHLKSLL